MAIMEEKCQKIWNWCINIFVWIMIALLCIAFKLDNSAFKTTAGVILMFAIVIYIISAFVSTPFIVFYAMSEIPYFSEYMEKMFYTPMRKIMHAVCYHFESHLVRVYHPPPSHSHSNSHAQHTNTNKGYYTTTREVSKVPTVDTCEDFDYSSWRDISGKLEIKAGGCCVNENKLAFAIIKLDIEMKFTNDGTQQDYDRQFEAFFIVCILLQF